MAPSSPRTSSSNLKPHLSTFALIGVALITLIFLLNWLFRRRRPALAAPETNYLIQNNSSSSRNPTYSNSAQSNDDLYTPLLRASASSRLNRNHPPTSPQHHRAPLRSSDLAFALSLPRPSLHNHALDLADDPAPTIDVPTVSADQNTKEENENETDKGAVSSRGHATTSLLGNDTALRHTNLLARHPLYRRRVRTWEVGVRPEQPPAESALGKGEDGDEQPEKRLLLERSGTW